MKVDVRFAWWWFAVAILVTLWVTPVSGDGLAAIRERGELVWGADAEGGGPYVYPRDDNPAQFQGFEVELAEILARRLGVRARFSQGQWDKLPDLLQRGDIDIVLNGYEWKPEWSGRFGMSIPYYVYELQMLSRRNDERFRDLTDFGRSAGAPFRVGVLGGSAAEAYLRKTFPDTVTPVVFDGNTDAMRATELTIDGLDATLQDLPIVTFYESRFEQLQRTGSPVAPGYYVILVRHDDTALLSELNAAILACWQDGQIPAVLQRYGLWNATQQRRGLLTDPQGNFRIDPPGNDATAAQAAQSANGGSARYLQRIPFLLHGAALTVFLSVTAMPLAIAAGLLIAVGRLYGPALLRYPLCWYVEVMRGTPLVLQLYLIFFLLPELGLTLPALGAAVLGLSMNYAAYEAEIYRAGLQAIPRGQMEAALSLGMSRGLALRRIIIPQAVRVMIPPVTNDFIALFKDTAVCSVITVVELSKEYYIHAQSTGAVVELGIVTAIFYLAMSYPLTLLVRTLESRLAEGKSHA